jgi:hypothetical protein
MHEANLRFEPPDLADQYGDFFVVSFAFGKDQIEPAFRFNQPMAQPGRHVHRPFEMFRLRSLMRCELKLSPQLEHVSGIGITVQFRRFRQAHFTSFQISLDLGRGQRFDFRRGLPSMGCGFLSITSRTAN